MVGQNDRKLTRRQFVKLSFGLFAVTVVAGAQRFLERLEKTETCVSSGRDDTEVASLTMAQYLQSHPELPAGSSLQGDINRRTLVSRDAVLVVNESAHFVLSRCDGSTTVRELGEALVAHFDVSFHRVQKDLVSFLNCLYRLDVMSFSLAYRLDEQYEVKASGRSIWATIEI